MLETCQGDGECASQLADTKGGAPAKLAGDAASRKKCKTSPGSQNRGPINPGIQHDTMCHKRNSLFVVSALAPSAVKMISGKSLTVAGTAFDAARQLPTRSKRSVPVFDREKKRKRAAVRGTGHPLTEKKMRTRETKMQGAGVRAEKFRTGGLQKGSKISDTAHVQRPVRATIDRRSGWVWPS